MLTRTRNSLLVARMSLAVFALAVPTVATACSCLDLYDLRHAVAKSDLVFSGEVERVGIVELPEVLYSENASGEWVPSQHMVRKGVVTLRTLHEWKGNHAVRYTILAGAPPETPLPPGLIVADCERHLEIGHPYLIYATEGYPEADWCLPTTELERAGEQIDELNALSREAAATKDKPVNR
jgi:hypothetical protein